MNTNPSGLYMFCLCCVFFLASAPQGKFFWGLASLTLQGLCSFSWSSLRSPKSFSRSSLRSPKSFSWRLAALENFFAVGHIHVCLVSGLNPPLVCTLACFLSTDKCLLSEDYFISYKLTRQKFLTHFFTTFSIGHYLNLKSSETRDTKLFLFRDQIHFLKGLIENKKKSSKFC